jgi:hypothetical protein
MKKILPFIVAMFIASPVLADNFPTPSFVDCVKVNGVCVEGNFTGPNVWKPNPPYTTKYGDWHGHGPGRGPGWQGHNNWGHGPGWGHYDGGDIGAGIVGGIIGGTISNWFAPQPQVVVVPQEAPPPPPAPQSGPQPWSPEWYDYCNGKYKSFDAKTGYYTGYDGQQHFCQ